MFKKDVKDLKLHFLKITTSILHYPDNVQEIDRNPKFWTRLG